MSINLKKVYFKKLEEYVGKKLNIVSNKNKIFLFLLARHKMSQHHI